MDNKFYRPLYFGVAFDKFEVLDFADNFLAGVRSNYFNSDREPQTNRGVQCFKNREYSLVYDMRDNKYLSWKIIRDGKIFQNAEACNEESYRVNTYNDNGIIYKRCYFDNHHMWLKTEYFGSEREFPEYVISPQVIEEQNVLVKLRYTGDSTIQSYLYPKSDAPNDGDYSLLAFTDRGFLYFNTVPNNKFITKTVIRDDFVDNLGGFDFDMVDFNLSRNLNSSFDIRNSEYLGDDNGKPYHILTNKPFNESASPFDSDAPLEESVNICSENASPDAAVESCGEKYSYYGSVDSRGKREGVGRTVTSRGTTAYEGGYKDDKRNGFGVFYYKDGRVNYVGSWRDNIRHGFGVGFRGADGTAHIGKWENNLPRDIGARFDRDGNFIFLGKFIDGKKQDIGISVDEDGSFIVSEFEDDRVVSSQKLEDLM